MNPKRSILICFYPSIRALNSEKNSIPLIAFLAVACKYDRMCTFFRGKSGIV